MDSVLNMLQKKDNLPVCDFACLSMADGFNCCVFANCIKVMLHACVKRVIDSVLST